MKVERGVAAALGAALLFGGSAPLAKLLLAHAGPWLLASLLYLGSGAGLFLWRLLQRAETVHIPRGEKRWLAGAILSGGVVGPVLLMTGLAAMPAATASLLLNAEGALTAVLAWFVFKENFDRRIAWGVLFIIAGAVLLSWPGGATPQPGWPALAILGACLAWAIDNNLTRKVSLADAGFIAMVKGLGAGSTNLVLALWLGAQWPALPTLAAAGALGFLSYGASLVLFVVALRHLGAARTGAYFSVAPFFGALLSILLLGEQPSVTLIIAGMLMTLGVWLHLTERHAHPHDHEPLEHVHDHRHDEHHQHEHDIPVPPGARHSHRHTHVATTHSHPHYPDAHHTHEH